MKSRIEKWGRSLAVRLPKWLVAASGLAEGTKVDLQILKDRIVIHPAQPRYTLAELLKGVRRSNLHPEIDWGPPVGREVW